MGVLRANDKISLQSLYKKIILRFSKLTGKDLGEIYLTDELMLEYGLKEQIGFPKESIHK